MNIGIPPPGSPGHFLPRLLPGPEGTLYAVILLIVALALIFAGRSIIKALAFLVVGLAGAGFGFAAGGLVLGFLGAAIGAVVGFIIGGLIGILLVHVGMGLALGYFGFLITRDLTNIFVLAVVVGIILFIVGVALTSKLLELVTAALGGIILYGVLTFFGLEPTFAVVVALVLAIAGFYVQQRRTRMRGFRGYSRVV